VSVGARCEVCRRRSREPAAESVRVRRKETVIERAGPEAVTVSIGARGKRARKYREAGSERACGAWAITSRGALRHSETLTSGTREHKLLRLTSLLRRQLPFHQIKNGTNATMGRRFNLRAIRTSPQHSRICTGRKKKDEEASSSFVACQIACDISMTLCRKLLVQHWAL
jgi:hypothetical protein